MSGRPPGPVCKSQYHAKNHHKLKSKTKGPGVTQGEGQLLTHRGGRLLEGQPAPGSLIRGGLLVPAAPRRTCPAGTAETPRMEPQEGPAGAVLPAGEAAG